GEWSRIPLAWDDAAGVLTIGAREGAYPGMPATRELRVRFVDGPRGDNGALEPAADVTVVYGGSEGGVERPGACRAARAWRPPPRPSPARGGRGAVHDRVATAPAPRATSSLPRVRGRAGVGAATASSRPHPHPAPTIRHELRPAPPRRPQGRDPRRRRRRAWPRPGGSTRRRRCAAFRSRCGR